MSTNVVAVAVADQIATLTINNPPVNTITAELRDGLRQAFSQVEATRGLKGVLLQCAGSTFCSGADIGEFDGPPKEVEYRELFARLEALPAPVVVALHGTVLGGGLELALCGHYRVAAQKTRLGFPEVTLGIFPGATGTQRMPRLIGVERSLDMIISARPIDAPTALQYGVIDHIVEGDLSTGAMAFLRSLIAAGKGPRRTSELKIDLATATEAVFAAATVQAKKLYPHREAPFSAIEAVRAAVALPFAQGLERETALVNVCKGRVESRAAIHVFFAERECRKVPGLPADSAARPVAKAGIIGAGTMGGGIAICFANAGIPVTIIDINEAALQRGLGVVSDTFESQVKRGRITAEAKAKLMGLIKGSLSYDDLRDADVIIEAAVERMDLKKDVFRRMDAVAKPGCLLATNTSTLDIDELATAVKRPADVVGMHFFSPANVMPLLEVIRTKSSSGSAIKTAMELAKPLRKTPVLSGVCYGFIGNRMMEGYAREAERMVLEGATPRAIDSVLEQWGMAMGILAVFDMAGVDVGVHIHRGNPAQYPPDPTYYQADMALFDAGRMGQKNGKGYYRYVPGDRNRHDDPEALAILAATAQRLKVAQRKHSTQEIEERCLYPLLNEGFRILEEGIAIRAGDIDVVWTSGYGFPRYRGGPMFYAETIGLKKLHDGMLKYQREFGPMHWQPAPLLKQLADSGQTLAQWEAARRPR
jgi:3-hydroxyacyl-CoA dehydrogenase